MGGMSPSPIASFKTAARRLVNEILCPSEYLIYIRQTVECVCECVLESERKREKERESALIYCPLVSNSLCGSILMSPAIMR